MVHFFWVSCKYMTKRFFPAVIVVLGMACCMIACSGPDKAPDAVHDTTLDSFETVTEQPDTVLFWTVSLEKRTKERVFKDTASITEPQSVINGIRSIYPDIDLRFQKISGDTVYLHIDSASVFTNDMGTFGANEYVATVVLNLTSLPHINYVHLDFKEGSHATPGTFARERFSAFSVQE